MIKLHVISFQHLVFPRESCCLFRVFIYTICRQILSVLLLYAAKNMYMTAGLTYILLCTLFQKQSRGLVLQRLQKLIKNLSVINVIGMWRIDLVSPNKNHKIPKNTWYFKTRVITESTYTPHISLNGTSLWRIMS